LHIAKPGDVVGISALTPPCAYEATALCVQSARTLRFDLPSLPSLVRELPDVATGLVLRLAERARDAEERIEINMLRDTQSKVVAGLLGAARRAWPNREQQPVRLTMSPLGLSARVGLDVAAVKRVVLQLQQTEYLDIADEQLEIHSLEALQELQALLETGEEILGGSAR
jgi:CRP-like cAMP-binding protein